MEELDEVKGLKEAINRLAEEYCRLDEQKDSARRKMIYCKIWEALDVYIRKYVVRSVFTKYQWDEYLKSDESYYGSRVYDESVNKGLEVLDKFDPDHEKKAKFTTFLETVIRNYVVDCMRRIPNSEKSIRFIEAELTVNESGDVDVSAIEKQSAFQTVMHSDVEEEETLYGMLENFSNVILKFLAHTNKKNNITRKTYYRVFYSDRLIKILKDSYIDKKIIPQNILDAFLFTFSDFVLSGKCRTVDEIENTPAKTYDVILEKGKKESIQFPVSGKVIIAYFDQVEQKKINDASISQYRKDFNELLNISYSNN